MATYVDGLYTGVGRGIGPYLKTQAFIKDGALSDFKISYSAETTCVGGAANQIQTQQLLDAAGDVGAVSAVSGATVSSEAFIAAATQAMACAVSGYNDGTYIGMGRGIGPYIKVQLTLQGGLPVDGKIGYSAETTCVGGAANSIQLQQVLDSQTLDDVDAVAGATVSSTAFNEALNDIRTQASGATALQAYEDEQAAKEAAKQEAASSTSASTAGRKTAA